jgi:hypothetical protein
LEPRTETIEVELVGVQGILRVDRDFGPDLEQLYSRLFGRLGTVPDISPTWRTVGYWRFVEDATRPHFAGVQVESFEHFAWDHAYGLVAWSLGKTTRAI